MNKSEVIDSLAARLGDRVVAEAALNGLTDLITRAVTKGEKVSITGFGTFESAARPARTGRNPQTGEPVKIKKSTAPKFRAGAQFKDAVNGKTKLGREPKHVPLLPSGVTGRRAQAALAALDGASAPAVKSVATRAPAKAVAKKATTAKKAAPAKAAAKKATPAKAAAKKAPAKRSR